MKGSEQCQHAIKLTRNQAHVKFDLICSQSQPLDFPKLCYIKGIMSATSRFGAVPFPFQELKCPEIVNGLCSAFQAQSLADCTSQTLTLLTAL